MLAQLEKEFPQDLRVVYRHFPLESTHDKAALAAQASEAAGLQGKFWELHDLLFERQDEWATMTVTQFQDWLAARAGDLKLDVTKFKNDMTSEVIVDQIKAAWDRGQAIGMPGTPFVLLNGKIWPDNMPLTQDNIAAIIRLTLLEKRQFTSCPEMTIDQSKQYVATLHTEKGDIAMDLYADKAPLAVNSFIFLAKQGWYDGVTFHRVIEGYIAQGGDPSGTGFGTPGYAFDNEISPDLKFDSPGILAMANAGPGSNGSQFFITLAPTPKLDGNYTIFGKVISGMDVVEKLSPRDPSQGLGLPPGDKILSVSIDEK